MSAAGSAPAASKRTRILRRTAVGALLSGAVVVLLLFAAASRSGWIVAATGIALAAVSSRELARMGAFARRGWGWVLLASLTLAAALSWHSVQAATTGHGEVSALWLELACVALLALVARAVVDAIAARRALPTLVAALLTAWVGVWGFVLLGPPRVRPGIDGLAGADEILAKVLLPAALVAVLGQLAWARADLPALLRAAWVAPLLVLPLPWMWHVWQRFDHGGLVALIVLAKVGDIAGYFVGSAIGVRRPFPGISPGKTVAGCWGSLLAGTAAGGLAVASGLLPAGRLGWGGGLLAGAATNVAAQAGDLLESWLKRRAGVKDSANWFGPSGGVLDLVDSLLLAVPAALLVWPWCLA